ncbi:nagB/RpiA/CoA transferase-like superfamily protein isoform X2 [Tasmannia lanceolata]|uniref:nagB/RpiA/CoA transferase-like superfamily protein isoform X2 n=1 Tax=Tasmannia lanceolata TaxID=3420 RepID=UPI004063B55C
MATLPVFLHFPASDRKIHRRPCRKESQSKCLRASISDWERSLPLKAAAKHTVDSYMRSGMVVGLGTGGASDFVIQYLGQKLQQGSLKDIIGVPTSVSSANEAAKAGIPLDDHSNSLQVCTISYCPIKEGTLTSVIGRRKLQDGESIIQEKSILKAANNLAFIMTEKQYTRDLDGSIPVLVNSVNWMGAAEEIEDLFLGDAEVWRRPTFGHAGPMGGDFPLITREGHNVLDVIFTSPILDLGQVAECLDKIDGVVDHGVIFGIPNPRKLHLFSSMTQFEKLNNRVNCPKITYIDNCIIPTARQ